MDTRIGADDGVVDGSDGGAGDRGGVGVDVGAVAAAWTARDVGADGGENVGADENRDASDDHDGANRAYDGAARRRGTSVWATAETTKRN